MKPESISDSDTAHGMTLNRTSMGSSRMTGILIETRIVRTVGKRACALDDKLNHQLINPLGFNSFLIVKEHRN